MFYWFKKKLQLVLNGAFLRFKFIVHNCTCFSSIYLTCYLFCFYILCGNMQVVMK